MEPAFTIDISAPTAFHCSQFYCYDTDMYAAKPSQEQTKADIEAGLLYAPELGWYLTHAYNFACIA